MTTKENEREYQRAYREANREKRRAYFRAYRKANREKLAERHRAYYAANREQELERKRAYRAANPEKVAEQQRAYTAANPEKRRATEAKRRARENNVEHDGTWPSFPLHEACEYCGETENLACDHIYPVARGGAYTIGNYQTLCSSCNSAKGDKPEDELPPNFIEERIRLCRRREKDRARRLRK